MTNTTKPALPEPIGYADANNLLAASTDDAVPIIVWASGGAERGFAFDVPLYTQAAITAAVAEARTEIEELKSDIADALTTIAMYEEEAPSLWVMQAREVLQLISTPMRPDGTWNRDREACRQLAAEVLVSAGKASTKINHT